LERIGRWIPGNTGPSRTDLPDASIPEAAVRRLGVGANSMRGSARREAWRLLGGENLWKSKPRGVTGMKQGRKGRAEQGVKRLRKPEGAAQPGEASPVQVASRQRKRRRATNPMGGPFAPTRDDSSFGARADPSTRLKLWTRAKGMRGRSGGV
jgi:hypothetical protein